MVCQDLSLEREAAVRFWWFCKNQIFSYLSKSRNFPHTIPVRSGCKYEHR